MIWIQESWLFSSALPHVPRVLYKYFDRYGADVIERLELKVTPPNEFNDLFEVTPRASMEVFTPADLDEFFASEMGKLGLEVALETSNEFRTWYARASRDPAKLYQMFCVAIGEAKHTACLKLLDKISEQFGLICLSDDPRNLLMWSHYSDRHKGLVIGFDVSALGLGVLIEPVSYVKKRIEAGPIWQSGTADRMRTLINSKSDLWDYEHEHRAMLRLEGLSTRPLGNALKGYFKSIPAESISEVVLGFRSPAADRISAAFRKHGIHPKLMRAKPDPAEFRILTPDEDGQS